MAMDLSGLQFYLFIIIITILLAFLIFKFTSHYLNKSQPHIPIIIENYSSKQSAKIKKKEKHPAKTKQSLKTTIKPGDNVRIRDNKEKTEIQNEPVAVLGNQKTVPVFSNNKFDANDQMLQQLANGESFEPIGARSKKSKQLINKSKQSHIPEPGTTMRKKSVSFTESMGDDPKTELLEDKPIKPKPAAHNSNSKPVKKEIQPKESKPATSVSIENESRNPKSDKSLQDDVKNSKKKKSKRQRAKSGASDDNDFTLVESSKSLKASKSSAVSTVNNSASVKVQQDAPKKHPVKETSIPVKVESAPAPVNVKVDSSLDAAQLKSKLSQANQTIETLQKELAEEKKKGLKKKELDDLKAQIASLDQLVKRTNNEKDMMKSALLDSDKRAQLFQKELTANIAQLETAKREKTTLADKVVQLEAQINSTSNTEHDLSRISSLEKELEIVKAQYQTDLKEHLRVKDDLLHKINKFEAEVKDLKEERDSLIENQKPSTANASVGSNATMTSATSSPPSDHQHQHLHERTDQVIIEKDSKIKSMEHELLKLNQEIDKQRQKNTVLKQQCQNVDSTDVNKLGEDQKSTDTLKREIDELTLEVNGLKASLECMPELEEKLKQAIARVEATDKELSSLQSDLACKQAHIETLESEAKTRQGNLEENQSLLNESRTRISELEEELNHYKEVLKDTESLLSRLQGSVDEEEVKWREALKASEEECDKARSELEKVYRQLQKHDCGQLEGMTDLNFAYNCIEKSLSVIITKMEDKIKELEDNCDILNKEKNQLQEEMNKMIENSRSLESQLNDLKMNSHSDGAVNGVNNVDESHSNSTCPTIEHINNNSVVENDTKSPPPHNRAGSLNSS